MGAAAGEGRERPRVLVVGGGFAGLNAVKALRRAPVDVTLVDRTSYHLFQPLLYQVATGILSEGEIAQSLRSVLHRQRNADVVLGELTGVDLERRVAAALAPDDDPITLPYDFLVLCAGSAHSYFGHEEWERYAPGLKTLDDAREIRTRILGAFELAEDATDPDERREWLTFVVVGAGPTGVELSGQVAELARSTLRRDYRAVDTTRTRIVLIDAGPAVLPTFPPRLGRRAARDLERMGVEIRLETAATGVDATGIDVNHPTGGTERIAARTVIWAAGVASSSLAGVVARSAGAPVDRAGRVAVLPDLTLAGRPEVFVCGDAMTLAGLPGVAQVAIQQGRYAGRAIDARVRERPAPPPFHYRDKGLLATIGRLKAVAQIGPLQIGGFPAAVVWAAVHLTFLIGFANKVVTMTRWTFIVFLGHRSQRLVETDRLRALAGSSRRPGAAP